MRRTIRLRASRLPGKPPARTSAPGQRGASTIHKPIAAPMPGGGRPRGQERMKLALDDSVQSVQRRHREWTRTAYVLRCKPRTATSSIAAQRLYRICRAEFGRTRTGLSCCRRPRLRFRLLRDITATIRGSPRRPGRLDRNGFYTCPTVGAILGEQSLNANERCQVVHSAFPDCDGITGWIAGCRQVAFEFHVAYGPLQASPSHFGQLSEPGSNR